MSLKILIEPQWNVDQYKKRINNYFKRILIEPQWNVDYVYLGKIRLQAKF